MSKGCVPVHETDILSVFLSPHGDMERDASTFERSNDRTLLHNEHIPLESLKKKKSFNPYLERKSFPIFPFAKKKKKKNASVRNSYLNVQLHSGKNTFDGGSYCPQLCLSQIPKKGDEFNIPLVELLYFRLA
ncbi:hypothetical protein POVCU1_039300 [Plasmodium ovale curtisi]|uniref:Uncharacterized protein n=1 Tax=Plasmodium ovale curtisi TaxID=864141 RepID=A0A1A8X1L3_PLAOA|nr:hypothetical protein POVCU1_039300 [Plasmodium ovale curtisi]